MLYVIVTEKGRVVSARACPDGIDEAIEAIAGRIADPEEDLGVVREVVEDAWEQAQEEAGEYRCPQTCFTVSARGRSYGLIELY